MSYSELYADLLDQPGALLPILHRIQDRLGYVPKDALPGIADALNLSRAEVHGVVTFYHHFRSEAPGRCVVAICRAEACQAMGAEALVAHAELRLGTPLGTTCADGSATLEAAYCLGNCALSPAVMIDGALKGKVSPARLDALIAAAQQKEQAA